VKDASPYLVGARHASPRTVEQRLHKGDACIAPTVADFQIAEMQFTEHVPERAELAPFWLYNSYVT